MAEPTTAELIKTLTRADCEGEARDQVIAALGLRLNDETVGLLAKALERELDNRDTMAFGARLVGGFGDPGLGRDGALAQTRVGMEAADRNVTALANLLTAAGTPAAAQAVAASKARRGAGQAPAVGAGGGLEVSYTCEKCGKPQTKLVRTTDEKRLEIAKAGRVTRAAVGATTCPACGTRPSWSPPSSREMAFQIVALFGWIVVASTIGVMAAGNDMMVTMAATAALMIGGVFAAISLWPRFVLLTRVGRGAKAGEAPKVRLLDPSGAPASSWYSLCGHREWRARITSDSCPKCGARFLTPDVLDR